ncbi:GNAT family N-acetyltransferase [Microbispora cellulosiformans]|uniref:GNAT family N-acetyltransferase n=1 Tax=Microbispora cellulosiformans TaxID=2614688 RepID=A0A5J5JTW3_9ACTN|nr:GNAT family N-acetyltransferase [Microbispora cellulosiformans]KAA9374645.1 GNAT family N-acetyltransferase [Microbispora cellulosiformans]
MDIRDLTAGDLDAALDIRRRAFGPLSAEGARTWRELVSPMLPEGRYLGAFDGSRLAGAARINPYVQWWHGRPLSMGGVASVTVAPEDRGRGVGRALMEAAVERCAALGHVVSALYPATTPLYRSVGYEHAGGMTRITLPAEALRTLGSTGGHGGAGELRRAGPGDAAELVALIGRLYAATRASGPMSYDERTWRLWLADEDDYCYLAGDGFVLYRWSDGDIEVDNLVAGSEATARALWSLVGSASSVAKSVHACVDPADPVLWLLRERSDDDVTVRRWMLRVIDLPAAVAGRGFPAGVALETVVEVTDRLRPGNTGSWTLRVAGGSGSVTRSDPASRTAPGTEPGTGPGSGPGEVTRLTIGGASALFAGVPTATLRRSGRLTGGSPETDDALDAAFACAAYMIDAF